MRPTAGGTNMRRSILFLNRFYWPDVAATGQMLTDLAEDLSASGWKVTVVTSASGYGNDAAPIVRREVHNGVEIVRVGGTRFGRERTLGRLMDYVTYFVGAAVRALSRPRHDVYVGLTDPPFIISVALLVGRLKRGTVVYWVQDLFPQVAAALGVMQPSSLLYRTTLAFSRWLNARVDIVVTLGAQMAALVQQAGARQERTRVVQNWSDSSAITPIEPDRNPFVDQHALKGKFVVLYSGNAGRAHRFDALIYAARELKHEEDIVFLFVGGGHRLPHLKAEAEGLRNVRFLGYVAREELAYSLSAASVSIVTEDTRVIGTVVPSKTYGILASGRPMIFIGAERSDVASVVRDTRCGVVVDEGDGPGVVAAIWRLKNNPALIREFSENARRASIEVHDRAHGTRNWQQALAND